MAESNELPEGFVISEPKADLPPGFVVKSDGVETPEPQDNSWKPNPNSLADHLKVAGGIAELGAKGMLSGIGEIASGYGGLTALAMTGDPDYAKERAEAWQNFFTFGPITEGGESVIETIAPPLSKVSLAIDDFSEEKANGDPEVATAIKTGIWGSVDVIGAAVPGVKAALRNARLRRYRKQVVDELNDLGIDAHLDHFADDVANAAKEIGSESAGEMAEEYVTALRNAEYLARLKKNSLYAAALDEKLFVSTSPIRRMGAELTNDLHKRGYDLDADDMAVVRRTLDDMHSRNRGFGSGQNMAVHFNQFELLRKRINMRINNSKGSARSALTNIKRQMDDWMTSEFNNAAVQNGQIVSSGGALSGDAAGFEAYLAARKANTELSWFNDTKIIADLIQKDTSVDQFAQWLIGASPLSKKGSAAVVNKMKLLLGDDHPAIDAVRADFVYQLTEPLLQLEPNYQQFANNFDRVLRKNKPLADALGLQESDVAILADYARVADKLPASGKFYSMREIIQTVARLGVGHGVAKGAARVTFATKVGNAIGRVDAVTKKQIIAAAVDARFDQPVVPKGTPVYAAIIAGAALSGTIDKDDE